MSLGMQLKCISASNSPSCLIPEPLCGAGVALGWMWGWSWGECQQAHAVPQTDHALTAGFKQVPRCADLQSQWQIPRGSHILT